MLLIILILDICANYINAASISNPLITDEAIKNVISNNNNDYHRQFVNAEPVKHLDDQNNNKLKDIQLDYPSCSLDMTVQWTESVGSSVYSAPLIYPGVNNQKEIFISTFYEYIELLGHDGSKPLGWPLALEGSSFRGTPMIYDIDGDGKNDIGVVDSNANLYWIRVGEFSQYLEDYHIQVPKLKVKRDWSKGLDPMFVDKYAIFTMFDHNNYNNPSGDNDNLKKNSVKVNDLLHDVKQVTYPELNKDYSETTKLHSLSSKSESIHGRKLLETEEIVEIEDKNEESLEKEEEKKDGTEVIQENIITEENNSKNIISTSNEINTEQQVNNEITVEEHANNEENKEEDSNNSLYNEDRILAPDFGDGELPHFLDAYRGGDDDYTPNTQDYTDITGGQFNGYRVFDDGFHYYMNGMYNESNVVYIDPHVLSSPTLVDVNGDGHLEVIMAVSYYFDKVQFDPKTTDIDPSLYVAGGIACWDLQRQAWSWLVHLDLTTDLTKFKALIHASPTVADIDGDGQFEVLIGTSLGLLYILDGETGFVRRNFPMQFHIIEAQIVVSDITNGLELEIIVADMAGNLVVLDGNGKVIWDVQLPGSLPYAPSIGDIDGDGDLDVIIPSISYNNKTKHEECLIYAIDGHSGITILGYPIKLPHYVRVTAPITLVDLHDYSSINSKSIIPNDKNAPPWTYNSNGHITVKSSILSPTSNSANISNANNNPIKSKGLHMLISSFDGHVYIISDTGEADYQTREYCAQRIDVGEHIYSSAIVDDISGDGNLDILIGTLNGQVFVFSTTIPSHPLNTWNSIPRNRMNGFTIGSVGISVPEFERQTLQYGVDTSGGNIGGVYITFDIFDNRKTSEYRVYDVSITRGSNKLNVLVKAQYTQPGRYSLLVPISAPVSVSLVISMTTGYGMYYEDIVWVSISKRFYIWIKYLPTIPLFVLCLPLLLMRKKKQNMNRLHE